MAKVSGKLMNTKEVADLLGVSTQTILNWVNSGVLKAFRSAHNYMFFSRRSINAMLSKLEDLDAMEHTLEQHSKLVRKKIADKEEAFSALCNEIKGCNIYAFKRYAKVISAIAHRLVDIGEVPLTDNEHRLLETILSFGNTHDLAIELDVTQSRIDQMIKNIHLKMARISEGRDKYSLLQAENARLRKQLIEATTHKGAQATDDILAIPTNKLGFSVRTDNALARIGVETIGDLTMLDEKYLLTARGLGKKSLDEIRNKLKEFNITLEKK